MQGIGLMISNIFIEQLGPRYNLIRNTLCIDSLYGKGSHFSFSIKDFDNLKYKTENVDDCMISPK